MPLIYDTVTASNLAGYWNARQQQVDSTIGEKFFPARKQLGLKLALVKGSSGLPVVLKPSAFDTKATLRERMNVTLDEQEMPFFKESLLVKEQDRQQLNIIAQTGNQALVDTIVSGIFDDNAALLAGAHARLEAMRMQVLATGKIAVISNGVPQDFDYHVADDHKGTVKTAWTDLATSTPLADIEAAVSALEDLGSTPEVIILNPKTLSQIKNAKSTLALIKPTAPDASAVKKSELYDYLESELGLKVVVKNQTYKDSDGVVKKYYPDGHITLAPNAELGETVFGTTPEESDLLGGSVTNAKVEVVDTGITVTTTTKTDPVNVETKVSMIALPSFKNIDDVYMLTTVPEV